MENNINQLPDIDPVQSASSNQKIYKYLFFISIFVIFGAIIAFYLILNQKNSQLATFQKSNQVVYQSTPTIVNIPTSIPTTTIKPDMVVDPKQTLTALQKYLKASSPISPSNSVDWFDQNKQTVPLTGQKFSLAGTVSNSYVGKYGSYSDINSITEDSFKPIQASIDTFFTSQGFQKNNQNTFRNGLIPETIALNYGYTKGNTKCLVTLTTNTDPFGDFFCGTIDQNQIAWIQELAPVVNPTNNPNTIVRVKKLTGNYALGIIGPRIGGGAAWIAVKVNNQWKVVYTGQDVVSCQIVNQYQIPKSIYGDCY